MAVEPQPLGTFPESEATPNPKTQNMSLEELQNLVEWPTKMEKFIEVSPEAEPETPPVEPEPTEPTPEQTPEVVQEPVAPVEQVPTQEDIDRELLAARIEAAEANAKKLEAKLIGREAGENGYIQQLKERIKRLEAGVAPEPDYREAPVVDTEPGAPRNNLNAWAVQQASKEAVSNFMQSHPDIATVETDIMGYLNSTGFDVKAITTLDDPIAASREMTRSLDEAYWHVDAARKQARVAELQTRKADQVRGLEEAKRKATTSAPGSPAPPPVPKKSVKDLSVSELEAKMKALSRR